jgi:Uma2 family endonuclease
MSTTPARRTPPPRFFLDTVDWRTYSRLLRALGDRPGVRLTYDRGRLEIMSPLPEHEHDAYLSGRFIDVLTEELGLPVVAGRSTTLRLRSKQRGLEPDNCYWIAHEAQVRGKKRIDLRVDPPPDLAIEGDVTRSSLDRMAIYAKLGVPEVWRLSEQMLTIQVLGGGKFAASPHSPTFPFVTGADLTAFLALTSSHDDNGIVRQFRAWVPRTTQPGNPTP